MSADPGQGRALVVAVPTFGPPPDPGAEPELGAYPDLEAALPAAQAVAAVLDRAGYGTGSRWEPAPDAATLGAEVFEMLHGVSGPPARILRVSHRETRRSSDAFVVCGDGLTHRSTSVESWIKAVEDDPEAPPTLFVLDLCHAGRAAPPGGGADAGGYVPGCWCAITERRGVQQRRARGRGAILRCVWLRNVPRGRRRSWLHRQRRSDLGGGAIPVFEQRVDHRRLRNTLATGRTTSAPITCGRPNGPATTQPGSARR